MVVSKSFDTMKKIKLGDVIVTGQVTILVWVIRKPCSELREECSGQRESKCKDSKTGMSLAHA